MTLIEIFEQNSAAIATRSNIRVFLEKKTGRLIATENDYEEGACYYQLTLDDFIRSDWMVDERLQSSKG